MVALKPTIDATFGLFQETDLRHVRESLVLIGFSPLSQFSQISLVEREQLKIALQFVVKQDHSFFGS